MGKIIELVAGAFIGVAASVLLDDSEWWVPLLCAGGFYALCVAARWIYGRTPMGKGKRVRQAKLDAPAVVQAASPTRVTIIGGSSFDNHGDGVRVEGGAEVSVRDLKNFGNKGSGYNIK